VSLVPHPDYQNRIRYLARAFVDAQGVELTLATLGEFAGRAAGLANWTPRPIVEVTEGAPRERLALVSPAGQVLAFLTVSLDFTSLPTDIHGSNLGTFEDFARMAGDILAQGLDLLGGRRAHRAALVQEGLLRATGPERLDAIGRRLLQGPEIFFGDRRSPFEWDWRCATRRALAVAGGDEESNLIATVKRSSGQLQDPRSGTREDFDRIRLDLDVNTLPTNAAARFGANELREYFRAAEAAHSRLAGQMLDLLGEAPNA
jgi:hypothetical protein